MPKCPNCRAIRKNPIRNGTLGDSELRCISALNVEINLENTSKKTL
jgi:hypothetical protein